MPIATAAISSPARKPICGPAYRITAGRDAAALRPRLVTAPARKSASGVSVCANDCFLPEQLGSGPPSFIDGYALQGCALVDRHEKPSQRRATVRLRPPIREQTLVITPGIGQRHPASRQPCKPTIRRGNLLWAMGWLSTGAMTAAVTALYSRS